MGRICKVNAPIKSLIYMHHLSDCVRRGTMTRVVSYAVYSAVFFMQQRGHKGFLGAFIVPFSVTRLTELTATSFQCSIFTGKKCTHKAWKSRGGQCCSSGPGAPSARRGSQRPARRAGLPRSAQPALNAPQSAAVGLWS